MFGIDDIALTVVEEAGEIAIEGTSETVMETGIESALETVSESTVTIEEEFSSETLFNVLNKNESVVEEVEINSKTEIADCSVHDSPEFRSGEFVNDVVPEGHNGINAEGRTLDEIVHDPVTQSCKETAEQNLVKSEASQESIDRLLNDFCSTQNENTVPDPAVNRNVDLRPTKVGSLEVECPSPEEYSDLTGKPNEEITDADIRKVNYEKFQEAMAKEYDITQQQAAKFIGDCDLCIHESADGKMYLVPNNVHSYTELYGHNGYVSQTLGQLKC